MITFKDFIFGYSKERPLGKLDVALTAGAMVALVGANGSGKSTLLKTIAGFLPKLGGNFDFASSITKPRLSYLPQYVEFDRQFPISVSQLLLLGLLPQLGLTAGAGARQQQEIRQTLAKVELEHYCDADIGQLSGGQMQRALFARLLLEKADLILLDESFSGVDIYNIHALLAILEQLRSQGSTIIASTHSIDLVRQHFDTVIWLKNSTTTVIGAAGEIELDGDCCHGTEPGRR